MAVSGEMSFQSVLGVEPDFARNVGSVAVGYGRTVIVEHVRLGKNFQMPLAGDLKALRDRG